GEKSFLEDYVVKNKIANYAFVPMKSYVTCQFEVDLLISEEMRNRVTEEDLLSRLQTLILQSRKNDNRLNSMDLVTFSQEEYEKMTPKEVVNLRDNFIVNQRLSELGALVFGYHKALNTLIKHTSVALISFED